MGKETIIDRIREWLASKCWEYFLKLNNITEEEYVKQIVYQEKHMDIKDQHKSYFPALKTTTFYISIKDFSCEYKYPLDINSNHSIAGIYKRICKEFKTKEYKGRLKV